jgi:hypothetical protein
MSVPDFSAAVTFVPAGSVFGLVAELAELTAADARTNATTPTAAIKVFMCADFIIFSYPLGLDVLMVYWSTYPIARVSLLLSL